MIARGKQPRAFLLGARRMSVGGLFRRTRSTRMRVPGAWVSERSGAARLLFAGDANGGGEMRRSSLQ